MADPLTKKIVDLMEKGIPEEVEQNEEDPDYNIKWKYEYIGYN